MDLRPLGDSPLRIAPLALGGNVFGWTADEPTSHALLERFADAGGTMIDTADSYNKWVPGHVGGESETIIGNWLAKSGRRQQMVIATKVGSEITAERKGLRRDYILRSVEGSLERLQTDYIDVYFSHVDDQTVPLEETLAAHDQLVRAGKVRVAGCSNYTAARLQEALGVSAAKGLSRYQCLQPQYNLYDRVLFEDALQPACREGNVSVVPYYPLAAGFLSGRYRSAAAIEGKARAARLANYLTPRGLRILDALDAVGKRVGGTPAQVALAWVMGQPTIAAPIASATSIAQLDELLGAMRLQLDTAARAALDAASAEAPAGGN
jgi:aryl-alcohol dehydrogenase-like predicted oxidoreductase